MYSKRVLFLDDWTDALNVAKENLSSSKMLFEREHYRDSITLSYYAMHSSAMAYFNKRNIYTKTHDGVLRKLSKCVKKGVFSRQCYGYLYDARDIRNKSSYDFSAVFSRELAEEIICNAEEFIQEIESIL